jgi:hypothetical protein
MLPMSTAKYAALPTAVGCTFLQSSAPQYCLASLKFRSLLHNATWARASVFRLVLTDWLSMLPALG